MGAFDHELQICDCCVRNAVTSGRGTQGTTLGTVLPPGVAAKGMVNAAVPSVPELPSWACWQVQQGLSHRPRQQTC